MKYQKNGVCETEIRKLEDDLVKADKQGGSSKIILIQDSLRQKYEEHESILRKKSGILWLEKGDNNTAFFIDAVKMKSWRNIIHGVIRERVWISNPKRAKDIIASHFELRFSRPLSNIALI